MLGGSEIRIPARVYFPRLELNRLMKLTEVQECVLAAIMTRHHSGFQREYWAKILCKHPSDLSAVFLGYLLGDYVVQILASLDASLGAEWDPYFGAFATANPEYVRPMNHRVIDYWTIYYRRPYLWLTDYPGYIVASRLGLWDSKVAPKLIRKANKAARRIAHPL
jgi:hypothetical protein